MNGQGMTDYLNTNYGAQLGLDAYKGKSFSFEFDRTKGRTSRLDYMFFSNGVGTCQ